MIFAFGGHLTISFFSNSRPHTIKCGDLSEVWTYNSPTFAGNGDGRPLGNGCQLRHRVGRDANPYCTVITITSPYLDCEFAILNWHDFWSNSIRRYGHTTQQQGKFLWAHKTIKFPESKQVTPSDSAGYEPL